MKKSKTRHRDKRRLRKLRFDSLLLMLREELVPMLLEHLKALSETDTATKPAE